MGTDQQLLRKNYVKNNQGTFSVVTYPFRYVLQEQRFVCLLIGIAISCLLFSFVPSGGLPREKRVMISSSDHLSDGVHRARVAYELNHGFSHLSAGI